MRKTEKKCHLSAIFGASTGLQLFASTQNPWIALAATAVVGALPWVLKDKHFTDLIKIESIEVSKPFSRNLS